MPRFEEYKLEVKKTAVEPNNVGQAFRVGDFSMKTIQVKGAFDATFHIEGKLDDGSDWSAVTAEINSPEITGIEQACKWIRVRTNSYSSGDPEVVFAGLNQRTF